MPSDAMLVQEIRDLTEQEIDEVFGAYDTRQDAEEAAKSLADEFGMGSYSGELAYPWNTNLWTIEDVGFSGLWVVLKKNEFWFPDTAIARILIS